MKITNESHTDHGVTDEMKAFIIEKFADKKGFFIETVELPTSMGRLLCGLVGPSTGGLAVPESEVTYKIRGSRKCASRIVDRPKFWTQSMTVIGGAHEGEVILFTAYGGPCAPREPGDTSIGSWEEVQASREFWSQHALSSEE